MSSNSDSNKCMSPPSDSSNEGPVNKKVKSETELKCYIFVYNSILELVPNLHTKLDTISATGLRSITSVVTRSDDFSSMKQDGLAYILANMESETITPKVSKGESKANCGFNHPQIARALCPRKHLEDFDADPETPWNFLEDLFNLSSLLEGLFRSDTAVRFCRHSLLGASQVQGDNSQRGSKPSKRKAWGIMKMTPHIVAWEMTKIYYTLSTKDTWNTQIGMFNLAEFYYTIAELLEDPDNAWATETLDWLTQEILGTASRVSPNANDGEDEELAAIRAQRLARKQATVPIAPTPPVAQGPDCHTNSGNLDAGNTGNQNDQNSNDGIPGNDMATNAQAPSRSITVVEPNPARESNVDGGRGRCSGRGACCSAAQVGHGTAADRGGVSVALLLRRDPGRQEKPPQLRKIPLNPTFPATSSSHFYLFPTVSIVFPTALVSLPSPPYHLPVHRNLAPIL
ncbi:hypothetical protein BS17DRAFT_821754 [Gyrodon lividus]|nr:hypothetical protein BS17DRAFT_821754 [Gyrodon lividus]